LIFLSIGFTLVFFGFHPFWLSFSHVIVLVFFILFCWIWQYSNLYFCCYYARSYMINHLSITGKSSICSRGWSNPQLGWKPSTLLFHRCHGDVHGKHMGFRILALCGLCIHNSFQLRWTSSRHMTPKVANLDTPFIFTKGVLLSERIRHNTCDLWMGKKMNPQM